MGENSPLSPPSQSPQSILSNSPTSSLDLSRLSRCGGLLTLFCQLDNVHNLISLIIVSMFFNLTLNYQNFGSWPIILQPLTLTSLFWAFKCKKDVNTWMHFYIQSMFPSPRTRGNCSSNLSILMFSDQRVVKIVKSSYDVHTFSNFSPTCHRVIKINSIPMES